MVVTFWPHPRAVLQLDARDFRLLTSLEEKKALLQSLGVDRVEVIPFTRAFAAMTAAGYLDLLREKYGATLVVMGYDNRIGSDHKTAAELPGVVVVDEMGIPVMSSAVETSVSLSSTQIRKALEEGDVTGAAAMLGRSYSLTGVVVAGNRLGRTIGFPTANMQLYEPLKLVPGNGVYAVEVEVLGQKYKGMTNIGTRPTVGGTTRTIETHILGFDQDIYGLPLTIRFLRRIRSEVHFPSLDALRAQLEKDRTACQG